MEEMTTYSVTLSDGTTLDGLRLNGNNFISDSELTEADFAGKLDGVTIAASTGETEEHEEMELVQVKQYGSEWWFILCDVPAEHKLTNEVAQQRADIDYLLMMQE